MAEAPGRGPGRNPRTARGAEMYLPLWLTLYGRLKTGDFNVSLLVGG